jgi:hypothetical protein
MSKPGKDKSTYPQKKLNSSRQVSLLLYHPKAGHSVSADMRFFLSFRYEMDHRSGELLYGPRCGKVKFVINVSEAEFFVLCQLKMNPRPLPKIETPIENLW